MLFHSYAFVLVFLPLSLLIYHGLRAAGLQRTSILALTLLSLFFYGWWNPVYLLLLVPLVLINFAIATRIVPRQRGAVHLQQIQQIPRNRHSRIFSALLLSAVPSALI